MLLGAAVAVSACSHDWDAFDPRVGATTSGAGGDATGGGGATTTSTTTSSTSSTSSTTTTASHGGGGTGPGGAGGQGGSAGPSGDCTAPFAAADPSTQNGDTTGQGDETDPSCAPGGAADVAYEVTASQTGVLVLTLSSSADLVLYVRSQCDDSGSELACQDDDGQNGVETVSLLVTQGETVAVIVDGFDPAEQSPFTLDVATHPLICGDGIVDPSEACDPPDGTSCGPDCQGLPEQCGDGADNDQDGLADCEDAADCAGACPLASECAGATTLGPLENGDTALGTGDFAGSCIGDELVPEALYSYVAPSDGVLVLDLASSHDLGIYVRTACTDPSSELYCIDEHGGGTDELFALPVVAGDPLAVFVDGFDPPDVGSFSLQSQLVPSTEAEPNGSANQASAPASPVIGTVYPAGDEDWIAVAVPGPSSTLSAAILDFGTGNCAQFLVESELEIYDTDGTSSLAYDDDSGPGACSDVSAFGLSAGTYYLRVASPTPFGLGGTFGYQLELLVQ